MTLEFNEQLRLMLIDKAAIGVVGLIVWFLRQRMLEAYKGRQALWVEISKEASQALASEWNEMNKWDSLVGDLLEGLRQILNKQLPQPPGENLRAIIVRPEPAETVKLLSEAHNRVVGQIERIGLDIKLDGFADILERFVFCFAGRRTTGQLGAPDSPIASLRIFF